MRAEKHKPASVLDGPDGRTLMTEIIGKVRAVFYPESLTKEREKAFWQDLRMLQEAVSWPAAFIRDAGKRIAGPRYQEIMGEIIKKVALNGVPAAQMWRRSAYLYAAIQDHWRFHADEIFEEAKVFGATLERELMEARRRGEAPPVPAVDVVAAGYDAIHVKRAAKREAKKTAKAARPAPVKEVAREIQQELF